MRGRLYRAGELVDEDLGLRGLADRLAREGAVAWVDLRAPDDSELAQVGAELGLHPLALEDARESRQRPKVDHYRDHLFLTVYLTRLGESGLASHELGVFVTERAIVTVHDGFDLAPVLRRWDAADPPTDRVGALLHGVLDEVADSHLATAQALDEDLEQLEDAVFGENEPDQDIQRRVLALRRTLTTLRRVLHPMRDVMLSLTRDKTLDDDELRPYFADVSDHVAHAAEMTEILREQLTAIRETQLNVQSNRLNLIMKKVTGWAAIIAIPTAITGFYGQNVPYPGHDQPWGVWFSTALILVLSLGLYTMFKRRDWL
ncbi:magnesium transporter CorA family protein [Actinokineospora pegani]|uniref:magnesium transporter CorA family protein n=1 Tax=Actinokineospora pegani TaxID=2654637 RepID=UPI001F2E9CD7|nr:magnesium transporter CorA family protein [Actinokineospora pegani]